MATGSVPIICNRTLLVDGDGLAYYCGGNDDTEPGEARANLIAKLESAKRACGAERVLILLTASGSIKGHRYAIATVKPYQGQRANNRRPKNWRYLRDLLESGSVSGFPVETTYTAEADDLFSKHCYAAPNDYVIYTQDKDMRMIPGWHLDWVEHRLFYLAPNVFSMERNGKVYGRKWFWLQMLHGDTADNIPGLPKYKTVNAKGEEVLKPVGDVTANKMLDGLDEDETRDLVYLLYEGYYGEGWFTHVAEQAVLLWMRQKPDYWDDALGPFGPLGGAGMSIIDVAWAELKRRVDYADSINAAAANSEGTDNVAGDTAIV